MPGCLFGGANRRNLQVPAPFISGGRQQSTSRASHIISSASLNIFLFLVAFSSCRPLKEDECTPTCPLSRPLPLFTSRNHLPSFLPLPNMTSRAEQSPSPPHDLSGSQLTIPSDSEPYSSLSPPSSSPPQSSDNNGTQPVIIYQPPTIWGILRGAAINLILPFVNGMMLGFGELLAHEFAFRLGWSGTNVRAPHLILVPFVRLPPMLIFAVAGLAAPPILSLDRSRYRSARRPGGAKKKKQLGRPRPARCCCVGVGKGRGHSLHIRLQLKRREKFVGANISTKWPSTRLAALYISRKDELAFWPWIVAEPNVKYDEHLVQRGQLQSTLCVRY